MHGDPGARFFLVRHGEVDSNRAMRYLGRTDEPLNDRGVGQAAALAGAFSALSIDAVRSSPLTRASATAAAIADASGLDVDTDPRLAELDFGSWEGLSRDEVMSRSAADRELLHRWETDPETPAPSGESFSELRLRVVACLDELSTGHPGASIVIVSHVGPIKIALCSALGLPMARSRRVFLDPATISVVDWADEPVVRLVNGHGHLGFERARWMRRS
jgi:broad specificity phosphatase PhoE